MYLFIWQKSKRMYKPASSEKSIVVNPHIFPRLYEFILFVDHKRRCLAQCSCCSFSFSDSRQWPGAVNLQRGPNHHKSINYEQIPSLLRACFEKRAKSKSFLSQRGTFSVCNSLNWGVLLKFIWSVLLWTVPLTSGGCEKQENATWAFVQYLWYYICSYNCLCLYVIFYTGFVY